METSKIHITTTLDNTESSTTIFGEFGNVVTSQ